MRVEMVAALSADLRMLSANVRYEAANPLSPGCPQNAVTPESTSDGTNPFAQPNEARHENRLGQSS